MFESCIKKCHFNLKSNINKSSVSGWRSRWFHWFFNPPPEPDPEPWTHLQQGPQPWLSQFTNRVRVQSIQNQTDNVYINIFNKSHRTKRTLVLLITLWTHFSTSWWTGFWSNRVFGTQQQCCSHLTDSNVQKIKSEANSVWRPRSFIEQRDDQRTAGQTGSSDRILGPDPRTRPEQQQLFPV